MGTRGLYGFRKNGVDKLTYNHYDSYPNVLGESVLCFISKFKNELNKIYDNIIMVDETTTPTEEQIKECEKYADLDVSEQSLTDWYCLLRNAQGDLMSLGEGLKYMIDNHDFILDSLFCEFAYIINLDTNKLEYYLGFQKQLDETNRYVLETINEEFPYYPCRMVAEYDLDEITECTMTDILQDMNTKVDEEYKNDD